MANKLDIDKAVATEPVEPEEVILTQEEADFFVENTAELNWHLMQVYLNRVGGSAARLAMYAFRMGREFEKENSSKSIVNIDSFMDKM